VGATTSPSRSAAASNRFEHPVGDSAYAAPIAGYRITVRIGSRIERDRQTSLASALDSLERRLREAADVVDGAPRTAFGRTYEAAQLVAVRGELAGPRRLRAGIDVRGDGSSEAWIGRLRRRVVAREADEDPYAALRRVLG
jgi:hypothetical protein